MTVPAAVSLYVTTANQTEAETIARTLVTERLAACANVLGPIRSFYWWQGAVQNEAEVAVLLKTRASLADRAIARVKQLHSYSVPCVVAWPIAAGDPAYLEWVAAETANSGGSAS